MKFFNNIFGVSAKTEKNTLAGKKKSQYNKRLLFFFALIAICTVSLFAQSGDNATKLDHWAKVILSMFTSTWLKVVCVVALIALCLGLITVGRNEPGMAKKFVPWLVGVIILLSAGSIVSFFFRDTSGLMLEGMN